MNKQTSMCGGLIWIGRCPAALCGAALLVALASGCSPVGTAVKFGAYAVGKVVDDADATELGNKLVGQPPSAADTALGERVDVLQDVNSSRQWITYPVKLDPLKLQRYVVEVINNRIVLVQKVKKDTSEVAIARALYYEAMVKGKPVRDAEKAMKLGSPVFAVRSTKTGELIRLYDAQLIEGLGGQKYCILRFSKDGLCRKLDLVDVAASAAGGNQ